MLAQPRQQPEMQLYFYIRELIDYDRSNVNTHQESLPHISNNRSPPLRGIF